MNISEQIIKGTAILYLHGVLDHSASPAFHKALSHVLRMACTHIILDFQHVSAIDSAGLGMIFLAAHQFKQRGGRRYLVNPQPRIRDILERADLGSLVSISNKSIESLSAA